MGNVESAGFKTLTQGSPNIILQLNREGQVLYFNDALVHHFRFLDKEAIVGQRLMDLGVWDELVGESWRTKISDVFASGEKMFFEQGFSDETRELYFDWTMLPDRITSYNVCYTKLLRIKACLSLKTMSFTPSPYPEKSPSIFAVVLAPNASGPVIAKPNLEIFAPKSKRERALRSLSCESFFCPAGNRYTFPYLAVVSYNFV